MFPICWVKAKDGAYSPVVGVTFQNAVIAAAEANFGCGGDSLMFGFFDVGKEDECVYLYERLFREPPSNFPIEIKIASEHLDL